MKDWQSMYLGRGALSRDLRGFAIEAPDLASLRTMYRRRRTLFEQQYLACSVLGFHELTEAQRRALVRAINAELSRRRDRQRLLQFARRWLYDHKQIIARERELRASSPRRFASMRARWFARLSRR